MKFKSVSGISPLLVVLLTTFFLSPALAELKKDSLWRDAVVSDLDVNFDGTDFHARWIFNRCHCGDMWVKVEQIAPDGVLTGELILVDGQVLLSKGFDGQGDNITSLMQAPLLMLQLANALLNRAEPDGPHAVGSKQSWDVEETNHNLNLNTGFATGIFAAPWNLKGSGWKAESGHRRFEFVFNFSNPSPSDPDDTGAITFSGNLDYRKQGFPYPESTVLNGWHIQKFAIGEDESSVVADSLTLKALREETKGM